MSRLRAIGIQCERVCPGFGDGAGADGQRAEWVGVARASGSQVAGLSRSEFHYSRILICNSDLGAFGTGAPLPGMPFGACSTGLRAACSPPKKAPPRLTRERRFQESRFANPLSAT